MAQQFDESEADICAALQRLSADRDAYLHYFEAFLLHPPTKTEAAQSQRLFLLYLAVTACDLLCATWLPAHRPAHSDEGQQRCRNIAAELRSCYDARTGGFHAVPQAPPSSTAPAVPTDSLVSTHCALHLLMTCGQLDAATHTWLDVAVVEAYVRRCQRVDDGGFRAAPTVDDVDVRFTYAGFMALQLLHAPRRLHTVAALHAVVGNGVRFVWRCWRPAEGGFAAAPHGAESHGGMLYCAVAALALGSGDVAEVRSPHDWERRVHRYVARRLARGASVAEDDDELGWCVAHPGSAVLGFQGRPAKPCDSCYTHWLGGVLGVLSALPLPVEVTPVLHFVHACSSASRGGARGVGREVDAVPDLVHSCLALSGALLLGELAMRGGTDAARSRCAHPVWLQLRLSPPHPVLGCSQLTARLNGFEGW